MEQLEGIGLTNLNQIKRLRWAIIKDGYWLTPMDIGLMGIWAILWDDYICSLNNDGIKLVETDDRLVWDWNKQSGIVIDKKAYEALINSLSI